MMKLQNEGSPGDNAGTSWQEIPENRVKNPIQGLVVFARRDFFAQDKTCLLLKILCT